MADLSTSYPHFHFPDEVFNINNFNPHIDRVSDWRANNVPWRRVEIATLHQREEFMRGSGYGRNLWNELFKGETITRLYAPIPEKLIANYNVVVEYKHQRMVILQHARPDFQQPRRMDRVEMMSYYSWMGVSV